jgi:hypothetical protein
VHYADADGIARGAFSGGRATPSENTVRFYLGRGYRPMARPLPELLGLEPEDVHMGRVI